MGGASVFITLPGVHAPYDLPQSKGGTCDASDISERCDDAIGQMLADTVWVGKLVSILKRKGMYDNTLIVYRPTMVASTTARLL